MKKIVLLLGIILLTGCSNYELKITCTKEIITTSLTDLLSYEIKFTGNEVNEVTVTEDFISDEKSVIDSIRLSKGSEAEFLLDNRHIITDSELQYKIAYIITTDSEEQLKEKFGYTSDKFDYIKFLEDDEFICQ